MSVGTLLIGPGLSGNRYVPEVSTGFADLGRASRLTSWIRQILPSQQSGNVAQEERAVPLNRNKEEWNLELRRTNAVLVTALIEASCGSTASDSTRPVMLARLPGHSLAISASGDDFPALISTDEPVDFRWSSQHYRVQTLIREFSEHTHANY